MAYSVGWGLDQGVLAHRCETAREALAVAEEHLANKRSKVVITDLATTEPVPIDTLRELAEEEAGEGKR